MSNVDTGATRHAAKFVLQGGGCETETGHWEAQLREELGIPELRLIQIIRCCDKCSAKALDLALCGFRCTRCDIQWDSCIGLHTDTERECVRCRSAEHTVDVDSQPPRYTTDSDATPPAYTARAD